MTDLLVVEGLSRPGLEPARLSVAAGACVAVIGGSGSGKSLLLRAIADLDVNEGEVRLDGAARSAMSGPAWRRRVVYVPAESGWWRDRVGEHFEDPDGIVGVLHRLGLPAECMDWEVSRLSTGERQRLALARALSLAPPVLLLDEPTSGLDEETTLKVEAILHEKMARGTAIVLVSHHDDQARRLAGARYRMAKGRLAPDGEEAAP
ncbi:MAG: ATP-binding cassette domain-containing protein [Rhodospirillaceae bacterium]|jgi:ABC-type iron transport system FetAB ATPase subunit